jgi:hypothetical protein
MLKYAIIAAVLLLFGCVPLPQRGYGYPQMYASEPQPPPPPPQPPPAPAFAHIDTCRDFIREAKKGSPLYFQFTRNWEIDLMVMCGGDKRCATTYFVKFGFYCMNHLDLKVIQALMEANSF